MGKTANPLVKILKAEQESLESDRAFAKVQEREISRLNGVRDRKLAELGRVEELLDGDLSPISRERLKSQMTDLRETLEAVERSLHTAEERLKSVRLQIERGRRTIAQIKEDLRKTGG